MKTVNVREEKKSVNKTVNWLTEKKKPMNRIKESELAGLNL